MQPRSLIVLILGLLLAAGAAMSLKSRLQGADTPADGLKVLVASANIPAGSFIRSDTQLSFLDWPKDNITSVMLTNETVKAGDFNGAVARRSISKGEPILKSLVVRSSEGGFMAAVLEPGKRAVSIAVDPTSGNAGFIFPGDHVDLILTHVINKNGAPPSRASETFVSNVRVLAVDQSLDNPDNKAVLAKTVTLEVNPGQAEAINLAKDLGKISLSLRSLATASHEPKHTPAAPAAPVSPGVNEPESLDDMLKSPPAPEAASDASPAADDENADHSAALPHITRDSDVSRAINPENAAGARVQLIRGNERSEVQFGTGAANEP